MVLIGDFYVGFGRKMMVWKILICINVGFLLVGWRECVIVWERNLVRWSLW